MEASGVRSSWLTDPISASRNWSVCERMRASLMACAMSSRSSVAVASASTASTRQAQFVDALLRFRGRN